MLDYLMFLKRVTKVALLLLLLLSCKDENKKTINKSKNIVNSKYEDKTKVNSDEEIKNLIINVPANEFVIINVPDQTLHVNNWWLDNTSDQDSIFTMNIKTQGHIVVSQSRTVYSAKTNKKEVIRQSIYLSETNNKGVYQPQSSKIQGMNEWSHVSDDFYQTRLKILDGLAEPSALKLILLKYSNNLNSIEYLFAKQCFILSNEIVDPGNNLTERYIRTLNPKDLVFSAGLRRLLYLFIENRLEKFDDISKKPFDDGIISLAILCYLRESKTVGSPKAKDLLTHLTSSEFYLLNKEYISKQLIPINNNRFKYSYKKIVLSESKKSGDNATNKKEYLLLDFWATWCVPCIKGIKTMADLDMPDNVKVVSISLDKDKDFAKWQKMTKKLGLEYSYHMSDTVDTNRDFLKLIELESLPRYILIDKDFNLIDQAFYHPQEPQFLTKLNDVGNYKRW